jgi:dethiobiotin synthetase
VLKPAQTGVEPGQPGDAEFVLAALGSAQRPASACSYRLQAPAAPLVAARAEGVVLDLDRIYAAYTTLRESHDVVLVEGAGGLLVPLAEGASMADLAAALHLPVVVVARPGLGTINHTLLTLEVARARGLIVLGVIIAGWQPPEDLATRTNPALICALGQVSLLGVLPHDPMLSVERLQVGGLRDWAAAALAPPLGGRFDAASFLASLDR